MSKSITVRLDDSVLQEIDSRCSESCCRSDFIKNAIFEALKPAKKPLKVLDLSKENIRKEIPKAKVTKISYDDGKTWIDVD